MFRMRRKQRFSSVSVGKCAWKRPCVGPCADDQLLMCVLFIQHVLSGFFTNGWKLLCQRGSILCS